MNEWMNKIRKGIFMNECMMKIRKINIYEWMNEWNKESNLKKWMIEMFSGCWVCFYLTGVKNFPSRILEVKFNCLFKKFQKIKLTEMYWLVLYCTVVHCPVYYMFYVFFQGKLLYYFINFKPFFKVCYYFTS